MRMAAITILSCFLILITKSAVADTQQNIYQYTQAGMFSPHVQQALFRVYVPNGNGGTVTVIDPTTYKVIKTFVTGSNPQHVVPSHDLQTLFVLNNSSNSVTPIDPTTGNPGKNIAVDDPYNLYFTSDGQFAIVVCEALKQLQFRDPKTMTLRKTLPVQCDGANHMDFTPDGKYALVTCEYSGEVMKVDMVNKKVLGYLSLGKNKATQSKNAFPDIRVLANGDIVVDEPNDMESMPQDIRSSADGSVFFVADMMRDGVILIDPIRLMQVGFIPAGIGTHAIYPSRDGKLFYVSNRGCHHMSCGPHGPGNISVVDPVKKVVVATWPIPQGGSPDMGGVTADGKELWLSGRYDNEVYVFDTTTGKLGHRITVGAGPHGLLVWPQPGRYSLGHTGNMR